MALDQAAVRDVAGQRRRFRVRPVVIIIIVVVVAKPQIDRVAVRGDDRAVVFDAALDVSAPAQRQRAQALAAALDPAVVDQGSGDQAFATDEEAGFGFVIAADDRVVHDVTGHLLRDADAALVGADGRRTVDIQATRTVASLRRKCRNQEKDEKSRESKDAGASHRAVPQNAGLGPRRIASRPKPCHPTAPCPRAMASPERTA